MWTKGSGGGSCGTRTTSQLIEQFILTVDKHTMLYGVWYHTKVTQVAQLTKWHKWLAIQQTSQAQMSIIIQDSEKFHESLTAN